MFLTQPLLYQFYKWTLHNAVMFSTHQLYSTTEHFVNLQLNTVLQDEVRILRQKLKEAELAADQDRYLRSKMADDSSHLVKENSILSQQVAELSKQLDRVSAEIVVVL